MSVTHLKQGAFPAPFLAAPLAYGVAPCISCVFLTRYSATSMAVVVECFGEVYLPTGPYLTLLKSNYWQV